MAGAFTAYQIGAGSAAGQETMQYLGTYGGIYPCILPIIFVTTCCFSSYRTGFLYHFDNPNYAYEHYWGKQAEGLLIFVCISVFTTITGYLWIIGRRISGKDGAPRQHIVVIALTVVGITVEAVIPLDEPVNAIYPIASYAGLAIFVCMIVTDIRSRKVQKAPSGTSIPQD